MFNTISFIGAGRIARIMLGGWQQAGAMPPQVLAFDANPDAITSLQADFPAVQPATLEQCAAADLVFGALHPPAMPAMLEQIVGKLKSDAVFCSLAPRIKLAALAEKLGGFGRLARLNPNSPGIIGMGYNPVVLAATLPPDARAALLDLLKPLGHSPEIEENLLETYAVISAMGPTYFGFQFAEVERLAREFGLSREAAREAMRAMLHGTTDLLFGGALPTEQALDLVPVRPMAEDEPAIRQMLQQRLGAIHARLTA